MHVTWQEVRRALRSLVKSPRFTLTAIGTLALGIGASTAIFSVVHAVLLRPLPFPSPAAVVQLWQVNDEGGHGQFSDPNFEDIRQRSRSFEALARYRSSMASVSGVGDAVRVRVASVSRDFFDVLGVQPVLGRVFVAEELQPGGAPAAIVSFAYWQGHLGAERDLSGLEAVIQNQSYPIVGVLPPRIDFPDEVSVWTSEELLPRSTSRTAHNFRVIGRLASGVSVTAAAAETSAIARELYDRFGDDTWMVDAVVIPMHEELVGDSRPALLVLTGAVGFLLLVACANVVNLLLSRVSSRQSELTVSAALGASRMRLLAPFLVESAMLSLCGGALGTVLAAWGVRLLLAFEPGSLPRADSVGINLSVLVFSLSVSLAAAFVLALSAFVRAGRTNLSDGLRERRQSYAGDGMRAALVVSQVGLTLVLLVGAGLLGRSLWHLLDVDPGFRVERTLVMSLSHPAPQSPEDRAHLSQLQDQIVSRVQGLPGITRAGGVDRLPMSTGYRNGMFLIVKPGERLESFEDFGRLAEDPDRVGEAEYRAATATFFWAAGVPLRTGRLFEERDGPEAPHVALVSESLAERRWPDGDAVGELIEFGNMDGDLRLLRVVGVVGDVRHGGLDAEARPTLYVNARQRPPASLSVVMETESAAAAIPAVRALLRELAPDLPPRFRVMEDVVSDSYGARRFSLLLVGVFAAAALGLAFMGIYGVVALGVSQRTRELGVRIALGASEGDVLQLIVGQGARLAAFGVVLGMVAAFGLTRFLDSLLFEVSATDPVTFVALSVPLVLAALFASYVPARTAARTHPMVALRDE